MNNEEQVADTIEMLYQRLNSYNKQDLFNYGYLLESNQMLCKNIEEKDKEIERLNNIINEIEKYYYESIENCKNGMNMLNSNSSEAKRLSTRFVVYNENLNKLKELKGE